MSGSAAALGLTELFYLIGAVLLGSNLFLRRPALLVTGRGAALAGVALHTLSIGLRCAELHRAPFTTPAESLSLLAWVVALAYLGTEAIWRLSAAGPFALGLSFLLVLLGAASRTAGSEAGGANAQILASNAISLHITATIAAVAAFALAFCCGALYLIEHHILKSKHGLTWMKRLPPLRTVETAAFTLVAVGFPLLTLGILSGLVRAFGGGLPQGWQTDPKALLAYAVWAVYGAYLVARLVLNWPPVRTSYVLLVGLVLCLLLFLVPSAAHRFG
jgi:ABC-type transport system involved in cytochrome c biogenesis permease subunit